MLSKPLQLLKPFSSHPLSFSTTPVLLPTAPYNHQTSFSQYPILSPQSPGLIRGGGCSVFRFANLVELGLFLLVAVIRAFELRFQLIATLAKDSTGHS